MGRVLNWLLSIENSVAVKELNHNATSVLKMKQRRFVQSVSQEGSSAAGKHPTQLMRSSTLGIYTKRLTYCIHEGIAHTSGCCYVVIITST